MLTTRYLSILVRDEGRNRFDRPVNEMLESGEAERYKMEFEWDKVKAQSNAEKHGVSFNEAMTVLGDPLELTIPDPDHFEGEVRFVSLGRSERSRLMAVSYPRHEVRTRLISAKEAELRERKIYEWEQSS